jgi:hypothetical protein
VHALSQDFLQEQDFPESMFLQIFRSSTAVIRTMLEQPHFTCTNLFRAGYSGENFFLEFLGAPAVIRATLEQIPLREILLLEDILG